MKILRLRFKNLNSLAGEWAIDFTAPEFQMEGIFAITGPTGSGKTTILDAICLALYGHTPRLGKITAGGNEIMSRQTGECFAELHFSTAEGEFVSHWSQRRSRNKADGKLQGQKHEIAHAADGKTMESMTSKTVKVVEQVCGMDFERFTRSSMLAQGNFAKFLESNANERAPILEQITGTGIYSELSILVHERKSVEDEKRQALKDQLDELPLLGDEEREKIEAAQKEAALGFQKNKENLGKLIEAENWFSACQKEEKNIARTQESLGAQKEKIAAFSEEGKRLAKAEKASAIAPKFAALKSARDDLQATQKELRALAELIARQEIAAKGSREKSAEKGNLLEAAKKTKRENEPKIQRAQNLAATLAAQEKSLVDERENFAEISAKMKADEATQEKARAKLEKGQQNQARSEDFLHENSALESLVKDFSGLANRLQYWRGEAADLEKDARNLAAQQKAGAALEKKKGALEEELAARQRRLAEEEKNLVSLKNGREKLRDGRGAADLETSLEKRLAQRDLELKIVSLSEERAKLVGGEPCPLCGAAEHPFADGENPHDAQLSETEKAIADLRRTLKKLAENKDGIAAGELARGKKEAALEQQRTALKAWQDDGDEQRKRSGEFAEKHETQKGKVAEMRAALARDLQPFGVEERAFKNPEASEELIADLEKKHAAWEEHSRKSRQWADEKGDLGKELRFLAESIAEKRAARDKADAALQKRKAEIDGQQKELKGILGGKKLAEFCRAFEDAVERAESARREADDEREVEQKKWAHSRSRQGELDKRQLDLREKTEARERDFSAARAEKGFADEEGFLAAKMPEAELGALKEEAEKLAARHNELRIHLADSGKRLKELRATPRSEKDLPDIRKERHELEEAQEERGQHLGALWEKLQHDAASRAKQAEKRERLAGQEKECARWSRLHKLIGSSDGKKFRNFAQGLTFELMVRHANRQLAKMNERYQLARAVESPLDLQVIDAYQAGEMRSTKNLSGGESFIVSLALALGLSKMASEKTRVDSLFLDEGFGTLDEEALDTALGALASLNSEGKLIGMISHVSALKERIPTQLSLEPARNGTSELSGPGVAKM